MTTWWDSKHPQAKSLQESNFLKQYNLLPKDKVTQDLVEKCLTDEAKIEYDSCDKKWSLEEKCVYLWTCNCMYNEINNALIGDDENLLKKYMPLIRGINKHLVYPVNKDMTSYRGSSMTKKQFEAFEKNKIYRTPIYIASSTDRQVAINFKADQLTTIITYETKKGVYNGREVTKFSKHKHEKEVLFPPYTAFKVMKIIVNAHDHKKPDELFIEILDNKVVEILENKGEICHTWEETHDGYDLKEPPKYDKNKGASIVFKSSDSQFQEKYPDFDQIKPLCFKCLKQLQLTRIESEESICCDKCSFAIIDLRYHCENDDIDLCYKCAKLSSTSEK